MEITVAQTHDMQGWMELVEIVKDSFPGLDREAYQTGLSSCIAAQEALIAKDGGAVVGGLLFSRANRELAFLAVHPQYRQNGIAKALILKLTTLFPVGTKLSVITYRDGDCNGVAARTLYRTMGFLYGALVTVFDYPCQEMFYIIKG